MTRHVGVQPLNANHHPDSLQQLVVSLIIHFWHMPVVFLQHLDNRWQQHTDVRHTSLHAFTDEFPFTVHLSILSRIKLLRINVCQASVHLENEEVAGHIDLRTRNRRKFQNLLHLLFSQILSHLALRVFKFAAQPVIGIHLYLSHPESTVQHCPQALMVRRHASVTHLSWLHPLTKLVISQVHILGMQPRIEVVDRFY